MCLASAPPAPSLREHCACLHNTPSLPPIRSVLKPAAERQSVEVPALAAQQRQEIAFIADAALASFVVIQAAIMRSAKLRQYSTRYVLNGAAGT